MLGSHFSERILQRPQSLKFIQSSIRHVDETGESKGGKFCLFNLSLDFLLRSMFIALQASLQVCTRENLRGPALEFIEINSE